MRGRLSTVAVVVCAVASSGCAYLRVPRIDPTGERVFAEPPMAPAPGYRPVPGPQTPGDNVGVILSPQVTVAPVGSEVVLVAGVQGPDGHLRANRRLEWSIAPGGVGHFVAIGKNGLVDFLLGDFNRPRKIDNTFAVGSTSRAYLLLTRGTLTTADDVAVLRGQGWITLSSPIEGTSHVAVFAPDVYGWDNRTRTATVHWVDAQWCFPPPAINPAGTRHVFTTTVIRQTDQSPCAGWLVRYEIVDGPPAGFAPDGAPAVEVATDQAGQASAEIFQKEPGPGTNRIAIQVTRPAVLGDPQGKQLVVASGSTMKTWTSPQVAVRKIGPAVAGVRTTLSYQIEVSNPGDLPAEDVVLSDELPEGLTYVEANPPPDATGPRLQWRLGQLGPGESRVVEMTARATQAGPLNNCAEVIAAGGLKASDCAATTVVPPSVDVKLSGPSEATVGSQVTFEILITNTSQTPATGLLIRDRFDPGLEHEAAQREEAQKREIERDLADLTPGQWQRIHVTFRATQAGRLCHTVEVTGADGVRASAEACVTAVAETTGALRPKLPGPPSVALKKSIGGGQDTPGGADAGLPSRVEGETVRFTIEVTNTGNQTLTNLTLVDQCDASLTQVAATEGSRLENNDLVWTIDALPAGATNTFEVQCRCLRAVARACNRAAVTSQEGARAEDQACLEIRPPPGGLRMTVADLRDPVRLGKGLTYEIRVSNQGQGPHEEVSVVATVPAGMVPDRIGTSGPGMPAFEGQTIRFAPVAEIRPGETLTYRVRVSTPQAGQFTFHAELTTRNLLQPLAVGEETEVSD